MRIASFFALLVSTSIHSVAQDSSNRYELVKMDKTINTFRHEAAPVISPDGNALYFFVQNHPENTMGKEDTQDIWMSKRDESGAWGQAQHLKAPFNLHRSNQVFTILPDGSLFIKGGNTRGDKGFSIVTGSSIRELEVKDFNAMNKGRFYGASMSSDQKHIIIYFSEAPNSPNSDLYGSHLLSDGTYSKPEKMTLSTNTDDVGPFIGPDQQTLYFASARQAPGRQGGVDIYKTTRLDDTWMQWSEPVNLGKPINTAALDYYFTIDAAGNAFTSRANKALDGGQLDLYALVPKTLKIRLIGTVYSDRTMQPVPTAQVELLVINKETQKLKVTSAGKFETRLPEVSEYRISTSATGYIPKAESFKLPALSNDTTINVDILLHPEARKLVLTGNVYDKNTEQLIPAKLDVSLRGDKRIMKVAADGGRYETEINTLGWYTITASSEGHLNATDSIQADDDQLSPFTRDLYLPVIEVGVTVIIKNIYFDFDKTTLKKESFTELNKVVDLLKQNPSVEIELAGHTDSKGSDDYNINLSQGRSQSVVDYIISQGIDSYRLIAKGYGEGKPIDANDSEAGRANNRRVEFTILKK